MKVYLILFFAIMVGTAFAQDAPKPDWSLADMSSQKGHIFVVTGGTSGIGYETAKALAAAGAILPVATALGFIGLAFYGSFGVLILLEAINRAVERGITRPGREALFTVVSREEKYKAKAFVDTFMYRAGDVVGAQTGGALERLGLAMGGLVGVVVPLALVWAALGLWLGRAQARRAVLPPADATRIAQSRQIPN